MLPSNKSIKLENIQSIDEVYLTDYPDVFTEFYYVLKVNYHNDDPIYLFYLTKNQAETDRNYLLNKIN
jgi:hypothetical protein